MGRVYFFFLIGWVGCGDWFYRIERGERRYLADSFDSVVKVFIVRDVRAFRFLYVK